MFWMQLNSTSQNIEYRYTLAFIWFPNDDIEIELTYNWDQQENYDLWNGYGHIALWVDDIYATCEKIKSAGWTISREPGPVKWGTTLIAFIKDPDGYAIELIENSQANDGLWK